MFNQQFSVVLIGALSMKVTVCMSVTYSWYTENIICIVCMIWSSHICGYEHFCPLKYNTVKSGENQQSFWGNILPPSSE
jgi:hypothetical protein